MLLGFVTVTVQESLRLPDLHWPRRTPSISPPGTTPDTRALAHETAGRTVRASVVPGTPVFAEASAGILRSMGAASAGAVLRDLTELLAADASGQTLAIGGDYRAQRLPSGYFAVYRRLNADEVERLHKPGLPAETTYLVADLQPLAPAKRRMLTAPRTRARLFAYRGETSRTTGRN